MKSHFIRKPVILKRIIWVIIIALTVIVGCANPFSIFPGKDSIVHNSRSTEETISDFDDFSHKLFVDNVTTDSITLNYSVCNLENYDIPKIKSTLGDFTLETMQQELAVAENNFVTLKTFDYDKLTNEQQLVYDILFYLLKQNLETSDYLLFTEVLGPTTGIQAQLPILLAEFHFYNKESVATYIELLSKVKPYFEQIIAFEKKKAEKGLFMSDQTANDIIKQCMEFINNPENNYLIQIFNDNIEKVDGLTEKEINSFKKENKKHIMNNVIPAYKKLISNLKKCKSAENNQEGLSHFKNGKKYYEHLVKSRTGSSKSISEINTLLDQTIKISQKKISRLIAGSPDAYYNASKVTYPYTDPGEIMEHLKQSSEEDFPALEDVSYTLKYIHESLQNSLSPAFYLTPPLDNFSENSIYINKGGGRDLSKLFTTIAHEGYPGHLYQATFFSAQDPSPIRSVINIGGYSEGWATYAELFSYEYAGLDEETASLLQENTIATLCVYAKTDIGINYYGWSKKQTASYLEDYGFSQEAIAQIFNSMVAEPASYLKYTLGYLEIMELRNTSFKALGEAFSLKKFHRFLLEIGPAPFDVIKKHMQDWIKEQ